MKNGREINLRPDSETGIAKLAKLRKSIKRAEKISMIAEGNDLSRDRREIRLRFDR